LTDEVIGSTARINVQQADNSATATNAAAEVIVGIIALRLDVDRRIDCTATDGAVGVADLARARAVDDISTRGRV